MSQGTLFGDGGLAEASRSTLPDPSVIRRRLNTLLDTARRAERMPWTARDARMWQTVFPQMANWLPDEEANRLRSAFAAELARLERAAE